MKYFIFLLTFLFISTYSSEAQIVVTRDGQVIDQRKQSPQRTSTNRSLDKSKTISSSGFDLSKLSLGGTFGLQFGDYTVINLSPQVGYDFSKYFTFGAGLGYTYYKDKVYDYVRR